MAHMIPLIVFMDDVSGNISKQWNKHHTTYMSDANLLCEILKKKNCTICHIVATCCFHGAYESPYGILYNKEVLLIPYTLFLAGDNPCKQKNDLQNQTEYKVSGDGYTSLFLILCLKSGNLWTPRNIMAEVQKQFKITLKSGESKKIKNSHTGVTQAMPKAEVTAVLEKEFVELLQGHKLNDAINYYLVIHMDTPTKILHVILLSIAKLMGIFQVCLESVNKDGLNTPCLNADYICYHKDILIEKDFKAWHK
ncbi:hypothetical protein BDR06DRAFT_985444 [Suillus hirtellus]|nr:hypothetical protein BDR06DRAFT_985444 [Suillus hirtellus]